MRLTRRMLLILIGIVSPLAIAAEPPPEKRPHSIVFSVVDTETGEAIPGVKIRYIGVGPAGRFGGRGETDIIGEVRFQLPSNLLEHLGTAVRMPGYIPMSTRFRGTIPDRYVIEMEKGTRVGGTVVDDEGKPVVGAKVHLDVRRESKQPNATFDIGDDWVLTRENGVWTYDRAPAGFTSVRVGVSDPRYVAQTDGGLHEVSPQEASAEKIVLTLQRGTTYTGVVVDAQGRTIEGVDVRVASEARGRVRNQSVSDAQGRFQITVARDSKPKLLLTKEDFAPAVLETSRIDDPAKALSVTLPRGNLRRVHVVDDTGRPVTNAWVLVPQWRDIAIGFSGQTSVAGVVTWTSAPDEPVAAQIMREGYEALSVELAATPEQQTFVLKPSPK